MKALYVLSLFHVLLFAAPVNVLAQGSLTPPGAPAPTTKTLDQMEPHTAINSLLITISTSGSYYLTGNLAATADGAAITIAADNVTIDLNRFTLSGGGTGTRRAIDVPAPHKGLCVRNGTLTGWANNNVISANTMTGAIYEQLRLIANSGVGILSTGDSATVKGCVATGNTGTAIVTLNDSVVSDCTASGNTATGILVNYGCTVINCTAGHNGGSGIATAGSCTIVNCASTSNSFTGIRMLGGSTVTHCTANGNGGSGLITNNSCTITDCTAVGNLIGLQVSEDCTVKGCTATQSITSGITISNRNQVIGCSIDTNNTGNTSGECGLKIQGNGNRIDGNHLANNNFAGLTATGVSGNIIIRNTFYGAQSIIDPSNITGPGVVMSSGGTITNTNPWANIYY